MGRWGAAPRARPPPTCAVRSRSRPPADERPRLLAELGSAESLVGDARAIGHLSEALESSPDSEPRRMAALALAQFFVLSGETGRAASLYESAAPGRSAGRFGSRHPPSPRESATWRWRR